MDLASSAPGVLIAFEGPEGSGKSTQIVRFAEYLRALGRDVVTTREPGGTSTGEAIREVLLSGSAQGMNARTEALLLNAARVEHLEQVIKPALARGAVVLTDRYADSTLAYQGGGRGLSAESLEQLERFAIGDSCPDVRVLFDIDPVVGLARRFGNAATANRLDHESIDFHQRVRAAYLALAAADPQGWIVLDASGSADAVFASLVNALQVNVQ